jgi:hypothetical protein
LVLQRGDASAHIFGGTFDRRFGQGHVGHFVEQVDCQARESVVVIRLRSSAS